MLRFSRSLIAICLVAAAAAANAADPDSALATRNIGSLSLLERDEWYARGISSLVARKDPRADAAYGGDPRRAVEPFLPFEGLVIRNIHLLGREAFGEVTRDTTISFVEDPADEYVTRASPLGRLLNALARRTTPTRVRQFLLFREGDRLDPFALADSERLLRQQSYVQDAKIEVVQWEDRPGEVDVLVLLRDRWPWGVRARVRSADESNGEIFHRNLGGLGLNLEAEAIYTRDTSPEVGWRGRLSTTNVGGTFVDVGVENRSTWEEDRFAVVADRGFAHPDLRIIGGAGSIAHRDKDDPDLPPATTLRTTTRNLWLGWGIPVRQLDQSSRGRVRVIPAAGLERVDYRNPPRDLATSEDQWRDRTRALAQVSLAGLDYYTTNLVYSYGETEDIPAGLWAGLVGGFETGEVADRPYHGVQVIWPRFLQNRRFVSVGASFGGFRDAGRLEDGVLDVRATGFGPLARRDYGYWRHFYTASYTLGINRTQADGLRLDPGALRDLGDHEKTGDQRLVLGAESILFTPLAFFGFKLAAFGYAAGALIGAETEAISGLSLATDLGLGLRLNNPSLVLPTIELRLGALHDESGWDPVATVRMGEVKFLGGDLPTPRPSTLAYQ
ncbi:MAG TPA: hypothetical protein PLL30_11395 [Candidatus Krumholzibacteria bacterium]|nr:hypothetical protein [Candidatus Krumholzibacteria bacterium]HPD72369.1 hypothetical protein [Candidatus Krumholzibacteria bacterium]HRY40699.1 hypothetical protein [Candidatus Krumholzibacteria bacterium]